MLQYDFQNSVNYWTTIAQQAFQRALNEEVRPLGITWRQCQVLGYLALETRLSQAELAERMGVEPPTLVGILDRMERDGWIRRESCCDDRRKKIITATPEAQPVWEQITVCARAVRQRAAAGLSEQQVAALKAMLRQVHQNLTTSVSVPQDVAPQEVS